MIRVGTSESFSISASLIDEVTGSVYSEGIVSYDIRKQPNDIPLIPALSGVLTESIVTLGIYTTTVSINEVGSYIVYVTCPEFISNVEEIDVFLAATLILGNYIPEIISESFGSINMTITKDNVRFSTKSFIPSISVSTMA